MSTKSSLIIRQSKLTRNKYYQQKNFEIVEKIFQIEGYTLYSIMYLLKVFSLLQYERIQNLVLKCTSGPFSRNSI